MSNNIAVGINKANKIWHGHFGISPYFQIYNREAEVVDKRINPHGAGNGHKHEHDDNQPFLIKEVLYDCNIFVGKQMGEGSKLKLSQKLGIETILTDKNDATEVVKEIISK